MNEICIKEKHGLQWYCSCKKCTELNILFAPERFKNERRFMNKKVKGLEIKTAQVSVSWVSGNACIIQVIKTDLTKRGEGIEGDPIRIIEQYWTLDGELLFEKDPFENKDGIKGGEKDGQTNRFVKNCY